MSFQVNFPPSDFGIPTVAIKSCGRLKNISHCIIPDTAIPYDFPNGTYSKLYAPKWLSLTVVGFTTLMSEIKTNMGILFNKVRFEIQSLPDQNMFIQPQTTWKCNVPDWKKNIFFHRTSNNAGEVPFTARLRWFGRRRQVVRGVHHGLLSAREVHQGFA